VADRERIASTDAMPNHHALCKERSGSGISMQVHVVILAPASFRRVRIGLMSDAMDGGRSMVKHELHTFDDLHVGRSAQEVADEPIWRVTHVEVIARRDQDDRRAVFPKRPLEEVAHFPVVEMVFGDVTKVPIQLAQRGVKFVSGCQPVAG
jgi:hypothetical protein